MCRKGASGKGVGNWLCGCQKVVLVLVDVCDLEDAKMAQKSAES